MAAGTEQQLVFDSEREKGGKEKATRGERQREGGWRGAGGKGHLQTLTMGMEDKRRRVFVYNERREENTSNRRWMSDPACCRMHVASFWSRDKSDVL